MSTLNFKQSITPLPNYHDGVFEIFEIKQTQGHYPIDYIETTDIKMPFHLLSISDRQRIEFEQRDNKVTIKVRIPQTKEIGVNHVCKFSDEYHRVYNPYHFTNKDGFKQTDLTFEKYPNPQIGVPNE